MLAICALGWRGSASADDPCIQPKASVQQLLIDLNRVAAGYRERGLFQVKRLSKEGTAPARFEATYIAGGRPVFTARLEQRDDVSEHLYVGVLRGAPGTLELAYAYGAGGSISCEYRIYHSGNRFVAAKAR
jgi:hypothetical protein